MAAAAQAGVNAGTGHPATASVASNSNAPGKKASSPMKKYLDRATIGPAEVCLPLAAQTATRQV
ncbi:TPA: hypothetical protein ACH3X1_001369 [Trebouxia sp. C0004]